MKDAVEHALIEYFHSEPDVADEGFSLRLMAMLPPQPRPRSVTWSEWAQRAQWAAMSLAASMLAALCASGPPAAGAEAGAAYALIGLLALWSLPLRRGRG